MLERAGIKWTLLGYHTQWHGFGKRLVALMRYLEYVPADKIIMFTDGTDVIVLPTCTVNDIVETFKSMRTPILFMAEKACWPDRSLCESYPPTGSSSPYRFLNGGSFIGYAWAILHALKNFKPNFDDCEDDQLFWTQVFLSKFPTLMQPKEQQLIQLDYENVLFQSLYDAALMEIFDFSKWEKKGKIMNRLTSGKPCVFHENGGRSKHLLNELISELHL
jgi:procollagen-lysine,2-oxoglutarate 5-dioxygenase